MKLTAKLATATAIGLLAASGAWAGSNNTAYSVQNGDDNTLSVSQDGSNNVAGVRTNFNEYLKQDGNDNALTITQTGNSNRVAYTGPANSGAFQTGNLNELVVEQTSFGYNAFNNGHQISRIRQTSSDTVTGNLGDTNTAHIVQRGTNDAIVGSGPSAGHRISVIEQTHTSGNANSLNITQAGAYSSYYADNTQPNNIGTVTQNGAGNTATLSQDGTGPVKTTSGQQQRGPANTIVTVSQLGVGHGATVTQDGHQNYVNQVRQSGSDNIASVVLKGSYNGATASSGNGRPGLGVLGGAGSAAALAASLDGNAGAVAGLASSVEQVGSGNQVGYLVNGGNDNQFGFWQYGQGNLATGVQITGSGNQLGVYQSGQDNTLTLAAIAGDDNQIGLIQNGNDNGANLTIDGSGNGGFHDFYSSLRPAGLTAGLIEQDGLSNGVTLSVTGDDNVFAMRQVGNDNTITGTQNGAANQAGVAQNGNTNTTTFTQTGNGNVASFGQ